MKKHKLTKEQKALLLNAWWKKNKTKIIYEIKSAGKTFLAAFCGEILLTLNSPAEGGMGNALTAGLLIVAIRAFVKTVIELASSAK